MRNSAQVPTSFGRELRACLRCRLIKTYDQFRETGCENCPFFNMDHDHDRVVDCTTSTFSGMISCMEPTGSWAARWLRLEIEAYPMSLLMLLETRPFGEASQCCGAKACRFAAGCYALTVSGSLSEELQS